MVIVRDKEVTPGGMRPAVRNRHKDQYPQTTSACRWSNPGIFVIDGHEVKEPIGMSGGA